VCLVVARTFEHLDKETSFSVCRYKSAYQSLGVKVEVKVIAANHSLEIEKQSHLHGDTLSYILTRQVLAIDFA